MIMEAKDEEIKTKRKHTGPRTRRRKNRGVKKLEDEEKESAGEVETSVTKSRSTSMSSVSMLLRESDERYYDDPLPPVFSDFAAQQAYASLSPDPAIAANSYVYDMGYHGYDLNSQSLIYNQQVEDRQEKEKWSRWAAYTELQHEREETEQQESESLEREMNRKLALMAVEKERKEQVIESYVNSMTKTTWFHSLISQGIAEYRSSSSPRTVAKTANDYIIVCPHYRSGCRANLQRRELTEHLKACQFNPYNNDRKEDKSPDDYTVVCPNTIRGCEYIGSVRTIQQHLEVCPKRGSSREDEARQREMVRRRIMLEYEQERVRRLREALDRDSGATGSSGGDEDKHLEYVLHKHFGSQVAGALQRLHSSIERTWKEHKAKEKEACRIHDLIAAGLSARIRQIWPFASVELIGSAATGLSISRDTITTNNSSGGSSSNSDVDLVICFSDQAQGLLCFQGTLIRVLAGHLHHLSQSEAELSGNSAGSAETEGDVAVGFSFSSFRILKLLSQARVPLLKASVTADGLEYFVDLSIDGARNTGLASTAMTHTLMRQLKPLGPVVLTLKRHLKMRGLNDAYTGGFGSYPLLIMVCISILRQVNKDRAAAAAAASASVSAPPSGTSGPPEGEGETSTTQPANGRESSVPSTVAGSALGSDQKSSKRSGTSGKVGTPLRRRSVNRHPSSWITVGTAAASSTTLGTSKVLQTLRSGSRSRSSSFSSDSGASALKTPDGAQGRVRVRNDPSSWIKHPTGKQAQAQAQMGVLEVARVSRAAPLPVPVPVPMPVPVPVPVRMPLSPVGTVTPQHTWVNVTHKKEHGERIALSLLRGEKLSESIYNSVYISASGSAGLQEGGSFSEAPAGSAMGVGATPPFHLAVPSSPRRTPALRSAFPPPFSRPVGSPGTAPDTVDTEPPSASALLGDSSPVFGIMLESFLRFFGEENNAGAHGYSAREYGFRFNIAGPGPGPGTKDEDTSSTSTAASEAEGAASQALADSHPHTGAALVIEDPISPQLNLTNNLYKLAEVQKELCDALERFRRLCVRHDPVSDHVQAQEPHPTPPSPSPSATPSAEKAAGGAGETGRRRSLTSHNYEVMDIFSASE